MSIICVEFQKKKGHKLASLNNFVGEILSTNPADLIHKNTAHIYIGKKKTILLFFDKKSKSNEYILYW